MASPISLGKPHSGNPTYQDLAFKARPRLSFQVAGCICPGMMVATSSFLADLAKRGWAISLVTLTSTAAADSFVGVFFLAIPHDVIKREANQFHSEH